jgi:predicted dinucleotide-binding enzyme
MIVLAVPYPAIDQALGEISDAVDGKPLVDASNALTADFGLALGFTTSGAEELQKKVLSLGRVGFDPVDAGPLTNARSLEALGYFNIQLGYTLKDGPADRVQAAARVSLHEVWGLKP